MKTKLLSGLIGCLGIFSANAQTITAPVGQALTITNAIDVTVAGGTMNVPSDGAFNIGGTKILQFKYASLLIGDGAGFTSAGGPRNIFIGNNSGYFNTSGYDNAFIGTNAGKANTTGFQNMNLGTNSGFSNTVGRDNAFIGSNSGYSNTSGYQNLLLGTSSGYSNTTGRDNNFIGYYSGYSNTTGNSNLFLGSTSGQFNTSGYDNSFIGLASGNSNTTGFQNTFLGSVAGYYNTSGSNNTYIGFLAGGSPTVQNSTAIGVNALVTTSNTIVLGNATTTITGVGLGAGSGLRFANLTSASTAGTGGSGKVLSVDANGNVILVGLTGGAGTTSVGSPVAENWKESDGYLYNNNTNGVVIKGTGLDGNSLIVKGGILSKEVNVKVEGSEAWPDYVFKPNYKRLTLGEVEKFIAINGHLPNIPSANEMVANGNNLGKTDVKLLEKVEELTLYLLDMKKANDSQAEELKSLKKAFNSLKKNRK